MKLPKLKPLPPYRARDFPEPQPFLKMIGPAFFMAGFAVGAGELISIPRATLLFGPDILWIMLLACVLQAFINLEIVRYTLVTGESFQLGASRLWRPAGIMWGIANILNWIWGNIYAYSTGAALALIFGGPVPAWVAFCYLIIVAIVLAPKWIYYAVEKLLMVCVFAAVLASAVIAAIIGSIHPSYAIEALVGNVKFGVIPRAVDPFVLIGAAAAAGAGGTGNLWYSYITRERGYGMGGAIVGRIMGLRGKIEPYAESGFMPEPTEENIRRFKGWWSVAKKDQLCWFLMTYAGILLFAVAIYSGLKPLGKVPAGLGLLLEEGKIFELVIGPVGIPLFIAIACIWLWSTQIAVIDCFARMNSDVLYTHFERARRYSIRTWYYIWIAVIVGFGLAIIPLGTPEVVMNLFLAILGLTMPFYGAFLIVMNNKLLPKPYRPSIICNIAMVAFTIFFSVMTAAVVGPMLVPRR